MLSFGGATRIYLAVGATDMRKGFDGLSGMVREKLQGNPLSGHIFIFCNPRRARLKLLVWDGSGLWLCAKRLERGCFTWPQSAEGQASVSITHEELALLVGGIDLTLTRSKRWWRLSAENSEEIK